jgi:transmembrane Fragile-X-F protein
VADTNSIGLGGLLTVLFVGLKLTHYITWSWWWVLSPLWIGLSFTVAVVLGAFVIALLIEVFSPSVPPRRIVK